MGFKIKAPKVDGSSLKNVVKNFTPHGRAAGLLDTAGITKGNLIDKASDMVSKLGKGLFGGLGGGGGGGPELNMQAGDMTALGARYEAANENARNENLGANRQLTSALQQQATGVGPLAGAALRGAQNRNLAQSLAAAQSMGSSPLATRSLLQARGQQSRDLAELGLQERLQSQSALGQQIANQANTSRNDLSQSFEYARSPMQQQQEMEKIRYQGDLARAMAASQGRDQLLGGVLQGGSALGMAALMSDEDQKQSPTELEANVSKRKKASNDDSRSGFADAVSGMSAPKNLGEAVANIGKMGGELIKAKRASSPAPVSSAPVAKAQPVRYASPDVGGYGSDERNKTAPGGKLPSARKEVNEMMDKLEPLSYEYKDTSLPGTAEGKRYGIVAQDLEKSSLGKTLVKNTEHGKMVDHVQGFGAVLAAQSELNRRLKKLEKKG